MKLSALILSALLFASTSSAQILIPGLVIMHTKKKEGYFQICMNRNCLNPSGKRNRMVNKRNKKRLKSATSKRSTKKKYNSKVKKSASSKKGSKNKVEVAEKKRKVHGVGRGGSGPATYSDK